MKRAYITSRKAYGNSKLFNIMYTREIAGRTAGSGVTAFSLHPGGFCTNLDTAEVGGSLLAFLFKLGKPFMGGPAIGAQTPVYLATEPGIEPLNSKFYANKKSGRTGRHRPGR